MELLRAEVAAVIVEHLGKVVFKTVHGLVLVLLLVACLQFRSLNPRFVTYLPLDHVWFVHIVDLS